VGRHWSQDDWDGLARRTSLPFCDVTPTGRERVGRLYNTLDELPQFESMRLISTAAEFLKHTPDCPVERGIVDELLTALRSTLITRVNTIRWPQDEPLWRALVRIWRGTAREKEFAHQLVVSLLRAVSAIDPVSAAELALDVAAGSRHTSDADTWSSVMVEVLARWADTVTRFATEDSETKAASSNAEILEARLLERSRALAARWQSLRPDCSLVAHVLEQCSKSSMTSSVTRG